MLSWGSGFLFEKFTEDSKNSDIQSTLSNPTFFFL